MPGPVPASPANRDYRAGFTAAMMLKDLKLAQDAAKAAGLASVAVGWGYCNRPMDSLGSDAVIDDFGQLTPALARRYPGRGTVPPGAPGSTNAVCRSSRATIAQFSSGAEDEALARLPLTLVPMAPSVLLADEVEAGAQRAVTPAGDLLEKAGVANMVSFNYRRVPAISLAKQIIGEGRIGRPFHYRATYNQDYTISAEVPQGGMALWRLDAKVAGSGVTGDLLAHNIDTAMYLNGAITRVVARTETFVKERVHTATGKLEQAARLIGWADATRVKIGDARPLLEQADVDRDTAAIVAKRLAWLEATRRTVEVEQFCSWSACSRKIRSSAFTTSGFNS